VTIRPLGESDLAWVHALNQANMIELSDETLDGLAARAARACIAAVCDPHLGFMLAFNKRPTPVGKPGSMNWDWLAARMAEFVYLDRIAIAEPARGKGFARRMYEYLFITAESLGAKRIACEVNIDPPNPASDAFHAAMGFEVIGEARLGNGKTVRYMARELDKC
jgi:hypothetical protein